MLRQLLYFLFRMLFDVQQPQRVFDEPTLDDFVHVRVVVETWTLVDLQQPWLELLIEHDVETQDLKALPIILVARFAGTRLVIMFQMRQPNQQGFYDYVFELLLQFYDSFFTLLLSYQCKCFFQTLLKF